jgi:thymidine kinase
MEFITKQSIVKMEEEGYLELILGSMFSGKTTQLIQYHKNYQYIGRRVAVINYMEDKRYHDSLLSTHDQLMIPCTLVKELRHLWSNPENPFYREVREAHVILINEGQFFCDLKEVVLEMVEDHKKIVYIAGLDGDFKRNMFGQILSLIPHCDKVVKLQSLCSLCKSGKKGIFSRRISSETSQVVIGSSNYIPVCRSCYSLPIDG